MAVAKHGDVSSEEYQLGQRIHKFRVARGFTQQQLADELDMERSAISNYETGSKGEMGFKTLQKFAKALGVSSSQLLGETENDPLQGLNTKNREAVINIVDALMLQQTIAR